MTIADETGIGVWRRGAAGLAAILVGIGLARFAYTVLTPALIGERWFSQVETFYLGATNLAGYLAGALFARYFAARVSTPIAIRLSMLAAAASFIACAWPLNFPWFFAWRLISGCSGGAVMVLVTSSVLAHTPAHMRGRMGGVMFGGVGIGITAAGTVIPILARESLTLVWLALGAVSALITLITWWSWPVDKAATTSSGIPPMAANSTAGILRPIGVLLLAYACDAVGFVPHTVFWIDYIARGLGQGLAAGGAYWIAFGIGAAIGPPLAGVLADRVGLARGIVLGLFTKGIAVVLPVICDDAVCLAVSSVVVGALTPGMPALMSGRMLELLPPVHARQAWAWLTIAFAGAQAGAGYFMSYLFGVTGSYRLLFAIGGASLALATILAAISHRPGLKANG